MSKRHRHDRGALLALALILGTVVLTSIFGAIEQTQRNAYAPPTAQSDENRSGGVTDQFADPYGWGPFTAKDTLAQWAMAVLAVAATGISVWGIEMLRKTLRATRKGNRINRRIGEAQVRAYIEIQRAELTIKVKNKLFGLYSPFVEITVVNNGNSPALGFSWMPTVSFGYTTSTGRLLTTGVAEGHGLRDIPPSHDAIDLPEIGLGDSLSKDDASAMELEIMHAFVAIDYTFTDVFGKDIAGEVFFSGEVKRMGVHYGCRLTLSPKDRSAATAYSENLHRQAIARELMRKSFATFNALAENGDADSEKD